MSDRKWPPLEVDFPAESSVRVVETTPTPTPGVPVADQLSEPVAQSRRAQQLKVGVLKAADHHIEEALGSLRSAVGWFEITEGEQPSHAELVGLVEDLAQTIGYRLKVAKER